LGTLKGFNLKSFILLMTAKKKYYFLCHASFNCSCFQLTLVICDANNGHMLYIYNGDIKIRIKGINFAETIRGVDFFTFVTSNQILNSYRKSNKMQQRIKILFHIYTKLNMFRATHRPSSGA